MRLFCFGDSFTAYYWPTWADCLIADAKEQGFEVAENWGKMGAGNDYIYRKIWEADCKYQFNENDWVFVCWSAMARDDRFYNGQWYHSKNREGMHPMFGPLEYCDPVEYTMRDCTYIHTTQLALMELGVNQRHWTINNIWDDNATGGQHSAKVVLESFNLQFDALPMETALGDNESKDRVKTYAWQEKALPKAMRHIDVDGHPTTYEQWTWVVNNLGNANIPWFKPGPHNPGHKLAAEWRDKLNPVTPVDLDELPWTRSDGLGW